MTIGKFLLRTILIAAVMFALGFVGHQLLLGINRHRTHHAQQS